MKKLKVTYRQILWTYVVVEVEDEDADDYDAAIEKANDEIEELCASCLNAWGNSWQPTRDAEIESAVANEVEDMETSKILYSEDRKAWKW